MNGSKLAKAFSYLIAGHIQALGIIYFSWWLGGYLNKNYEMSVSWLAVTIPIGVVAIGQTFYVLIRSLMAQEKREAEGRDDSSEK